MTQCNPRKIVLSKKLRGVKFTISGEPIATHIEFARLKAMNAQLLEALEWAIPILEQMLAYEPVADAMAKLHMTAEPNLSKAKAAIKAATEG